MKILLNSVEKVKNFVNEASNIEGDITITSGRYVVDAKSIMGIFSLNLTNDMNIIVLINLY